jgi:Flp pilus assembly protein TadG
MTRADQKGKIPVKDARRGATMVEFALFFMLFLVVAVALMELGRGVWTYTTVAHAARQGARYAQVHGSLYPITNGDSSIEQVVKNNAVGLDPQEVAVTASWESWDPVNSVWVQDNVNAQGSIVKVQVSYPFRLVTGPLVLSQNTIQLRSTSRMIVAN